MPITSSQYHRRLYILTGVHRWCQQTAAELLSSSAAPEDNTLWVTQNPPPNARAIPSKQAGTLLGRELSALVYDAHTGFDPDAFAAITGTVIGGGMIVLLTPPLDFWPHFPDPEYARILVSPYVIDDIKGRFLQRLSMLIKAAKNIQIIRQNEPLLGAPERSYPPCAISRKRANKTPGVYDTTPDQQRAIDLLGKVLSGHRRRPLVLISDRGRGKSAALGIAAAQLVLQGARRIIVTGPRLRALDTVFEHARALLPDPTHTAGKLLSGNASIHFVPPDELSRNKHDAELLLVDEAAAIPAPLLEALLMNFSRIAFATTIHGYEGSGRGFAVRFFKSLDKTTPGWRLHRLETPIRWAAHDPVERFVFAALMLDALPAADDRVQSAALHRCHVERLDRDQLARDEPLLRQLFGLLVIAHYRTRPRDLQQLLDGPNLRIYVLRQAGYVIATALIAAEGMLDTAIVREIFLGRRRLRGHLIPQSLAAHVGLPDAALLRCARIMRIAVHPALQNRGFGSRLVQHLLTQIKAEGFDWIGSDFGATAELLRFWQRAGLLPVRIGLKREASSGAHSALVLKPLSETAKPLFSQCREQFSRQFPLLLPTALSSLSPAIAAAVMANTRPATPFTEHELSEVAAFAFASRSFEDSIAAIRSLCFKILNRESQALNTAISAAERELLVAKVLQQKSWHELSRPFALTGRKQGLAELRRIMRQALLALGERRNELRLPALRQVQTGKQLR